MTDLNALAPCPFCGGEAEIERRGDRRQSTIYQCTSCGCTLETGEEWGHGERWNTRAAASSQAGVLAMRELLPPLKRTLCVMRSARQKDGLMYIWEDDEKAVADVAAAIDKIDVAAEISELKPWRDELSEIVGHLGAAVVQSCEKDDQIIMDHIKAAHEIAKIIRRKA